MVYFSKSSCISLQSAGVWCHHECGVTLCINLIHLNVKSPARFFGWVVLTGHFDFLGYELFFYVISSQFLDTPVALSAPPFLFYCFIYLHLILKSDKEREK